MRVLVALDSFKGTLSACDACATVADALRQRHPAWSVETMPMADGGEGTAAALVAARGGQWIDVDSVTGPLPDMRLRAGFGWLPESRTAVVEMACASGLPLLTPEARNPLSTTTRGTGELLREAVARGAAHLLLTLGGSATVDGGTGAARVLGWHFLDAAGGEVGEGGGELQRIARITPPPTTQRRALPRLTALCDVDNPLCGPRGAAAVYGPQKGATPDMVVELDRGLRNLAACIRRDVGRDVLDMPGAGAAGGFGAGAVAFLGAALTPGVQAVAEACGLRNALAGADWVITGEGRFDAQSFQGKVVCGVCDCARAAGVGIAVLAGRVAVPPEQWRAAGISLVQASAPDEMPDAEAFARTPELLRAATQELAGRIADLGAV